MVSAFLLSVLLCPFPIKILKSLELMYSKYYFSGMNLSLIATKVFRQRNEIPKWNFWGRLAGILGDFHVSYCPAPFVFHAISCNSGNAALRSTLLPLSGPWSAKEGSIWMANIGNEPPEAGNWTRSPRRPKELGEGWQLEQSHFHGCGETWVWRLLSNWETGL